MGISLSGGPWQYNRFDVLSEKAKPDYLDFDGDGNKKEPMKKALKEKGKKPVSEEKKELPDFIKKKMDEKKGKKEGKKDDCGCDDKPCKCDDKEKKEEFTSIVKEVLDEGHDLSDYSWDELYELYKGKHGQSEKEYQDGRSDAGKQISGDSKHSGAEYSHRSYRGVGKPAKPGERQKDQGKMTDADRNELAIRKKKLKKEEVEQYLVDEGYANNPVSAEVMYNHMSEDWLEMIEESLG